MWEVSPVKRFITESLYYITPHTRYEKQETLPLSTSLLSTLSSSRCPLDFSRPQYTKPPHHHHRNGWSAKEEPQAWLHRGLGRGSGMYYLLMSPQMGGKY